MTPFEFLSVALSFVLGLAVTLLLTSLLVAFAARRRTRMDWLPFVWAGYVLVFQFDFWWELFGLSALGTWSVQAFGILLILALLLFVAGALVLPTGVGAYPSDLAEHFRQDGRWGVFAIGAYCVVGSLANVVLFDFAPLDLVNLLNALGVGIVGVTVLGRTRAVQVGATLAFGVWLTTYLVLFLPRAY